MPDLHIEVHKRHASDDAIILEAVISGQHLGPWRGLPPTGRRVEFPLCGIFAFDAADRLAGEKIYYDRATVLRQLGVFHEPEHILGRLGAVLMHPLHDGAHREPTGPAATVAGVEGRQNALLVDLSWPARRGLPSVIGSISRPCSS